jgi:hypothetical protein
MLRHVGTYLGGLLLATGLLGASPAEAQGRHAAQWERGHDQHSLYGRTYNARASRADRDRDGVPNRLDRDDDGDGIPDYRDPHPRRFDRGTRPRFRINRPGFGINRSDFDRDGIPDYRDRDIDGDGVPNNRDRYDRNRSRR